MYPHNKKFQEEFRIMTENPDNPEDKWVKACGSKKEKKKNIEYVKEEIKTGALSYNARLIMWYSNISLEEIGLTEEEYEKIIRHRIKTKVRP